MNAKPTEDGAGNDPPEAECRNAPPHGDGVATQLLYESPKGGQQYATGHLPDENDTADDAERYRVLETVGLDRLGAYARISVDLFHLGPVGYGGQSRFVSVGRSDAG